MPHPNCRIAYHDEATGELTVEAFVDPYLFAWGARIVRYVGGNEYHPVDVRNLQSSTWGGLVMEGCEPIYDLSKPPPAGSYGCW